MWCGKKGIDCSYCGSFNECQRSACCVPDVGSLPLDTMSPYSTPTTAEMLMHNIKREAIMDFAKKVKEKAVSHCRTIGCYELKFIETSIDELLAEYENKKY